MTVWLFFTAVPWGPPLLEYNPAAHAVWWVIRALFVVLVALALFELVDRLREAIQRWYWRRREGLFLSGGYTAAGEPPFELRPPDTELRRRHLREIRPQPRALSEGRAIEPPENRRHLSVGAR